MKRTRAMLALSQASLLALTLTFFGCSANVGPTIDAPEIPPMSASGEVRAKVGSYLAIQGFEDVRKSAAVTGDAGFTEPFGPIGSLVETGLKSAFRENGISILETAPVALRGEIRKWRAQTNVKGGSSISSEATLYVEAIDPSGKRLYSGTYNGTRSSQFPVVSRVDVKDSLGLAMAHAISQVVSDPQLLEVLTSY